MYRPAGTRSDIKSANIQIFNVFTDSIKRRVNEATEPVFIARGAQGY
jgi:hypothetical protein